MKYEESKKYGKVMGLTEPSEFINNIVHHAMNIFIFYQIPKELNELYEDAKNQGIKFSNVCGCAICPEDSVEELCITCKKLNLINNKIGNNF